MFLALAIQGTAYQSVLKAFSAMDRRWGRPGAGRWYQQVAAAVGSDVLISAAGVIVMLGGASEILAIYALYQQQAGSGTGQAVLGGIIVMIICDRDRPRAGLPEGTAQRSAARPRTGTPDAGCRRD